jgi:hypothetical protein
MDDDPMASEKRIRTVGKRQRSVAFGQPPTLASRAAMTRMAQYRTRAPKGVFIYRTVDVLPAACGHSWQELSPFVIRIDLGEGVSMAVLPLEGLLLTKEGMRDKGQGRPRGVVARPRARGVRKQAAAGYGAQVGTRARSST